LDVLYRTVPPEVQIQYFGGSNPRKGDYVTMQLDGIAAGPEPRAAAEKFRLAMLAAMEAKNKEMREKGGLPPHSSGISCLFRSLEDQGGVTAKVNGMDLPTAKFVMDIRMRKPLAPALAGPPPPPPRPKPKG